MGLFSSSKKTKAAANEDTGGHAFQPPEPGPQALQQQYAPLPGQAPQLHYAPPPGPFGLGTPYQQAGHAAPVTEWSAGEGGMAAPQKPFFSTPYPPQHHYPPPNIVVNQHYYIAAPALPNIPEMGADKKKLTAGGPAGITKLHLGSVVNLATDMLPMGLPHFFDDGLPSWHASGSTLLNQGAALYDQLSSKFDNVMTSIDRDRYEGNEADLFSYGPTPASQWTPGPQAGPVTTSQAVSKPGKKRDYPKGQTTGVVASLISGNYFAKVDLYANSKLPLDLQPMRLYLSSYRLLSLAAKYSDRAYQQPQGAERFAHIDADWRAGTKAMVIKSVPMDDANTIVFAIRGTANFMDWAVNLNMAPTSPTGFLDDLGNFCHAGFLSVARKMIRPVAARLRQLLEEDPGRASYSLLITGHSAGGAVASLLYAHMLATSAQASSELNLLTGCFRRIHCITFGTPPVSLLPLTTPDRKELRKSLFYTFVNEGDPVVRADKAYVKSLIDLLSSSVPAAAAAAPLPGSSSSASATSTGGGTKAPRKEASKSSLKSYKSSKSSKSHHGSGGGKPKSDHGGSGGGHGHGGSSRPPRPVWRVPPSTLSNAGRIIVLRSGNPRAALAGKKTVEERLNEGVVAQFTSDEQLRGVIWGDPVCHVMKLYAGRIEALAIAAVIVDP